ncbi:MAG: Hpt domain-containing protein, partial [Rickettsiales bacterium]
EKIEEMRVNCRIEEQKAWASAAHYLKGSAASIGMEPLSYACRVAEQQKSAPYDEKKELLSAIELEFARARDYANLILAEMQ